MQELALNQTTDLVVQGRLSSEVIEKARALIPGICNSVFTGRYKRNMANPGIIATDKVAEYIPVTRLMHVIMASRKAKVEDMENMREFLNPNSGKVLVERTEAPASLVEDIMLVLDIPREEVVKTTINFKGIWLKDGVRIYHPSFPLSIPDDHKYLIFSKTTLGTEEFFQTLWKYFKFIYECDDRFSVTLTFTEEDGILYIELKKPEYVLREDYLYYGVTR